MSEFQTEGRSYLEPISIEVIIVLAGTVGGQLLAPALNFAASGLAPLRSAASCDVIFSVIVAGVLELLPAAALGALIAPSRRTGFRLAFDLLPAVLGGTASYLFTSLQLLPRWGTLPVFALSVVVLTAVPVLSCGPGEPRWSKVVLQVGLSGVLLFGLGEGLGSAYRYGNPTWPSGDRVEYFRVGRAGDVRVVSSSSRRWIEVNGVAVTSAARERAERALGAIPLLLRPHTTDIFVAGFGGGAAVDACLSWPGTKVVCCEPEPALVTAACVFRGTGQPSLTNQHFSLVHRDARTTLVRINDRFDVVLLDVANPRLPGGTRFFAAEFYKEAKLRLTPGGILCHRVHVDSLTPSGLALMSRTLTESFPFVALVPVSDVDALLIGSRHPVIESTEGIRDAQRRLDRLPFLCGQLQSDFQSTNVARLCTRLLWLDRDGLRLLGQADGKTSLAGSWTPWWNGKLATRGWAADDASMQSRLIASSARVGTFQRNGELVDLSPQEASVAHDLGLNFSRYGCLAAALEVARWGLWLDTDNPDLLADQIIWSRESDDEAIQLQVDRIARAPSAALRLANSLKDARLLMEASKVLSRITNSCPSSPEVWTLLARTYAECGKEAQAKACFARAVELDPFHKPSGGMP